MAKEESPDELLKKTFIITMICVVLFVGTVYIFIAPYSSP